ncbi:MAG: SBBP repeat-containing protein [Bacteroidetes bacterium]|nr:SBBP repeat-containing protein [Bacteroidota bacterium]
MRTNAYILLLLLTLNCNNIFSQTFTRVIHAGGNLPDAGLAIASARDGSLYVTGYFQDETEFSGIKIKASGAEDIFLAKYDTKSGLQWIRTAGSSYVKQGFILEKGTSVTTDRNDNVIIAGTFTGNAVFENNNLNSKGMEDIFVAKYSPEGTMQWIKQYGGMYHDLTEAVACDSKNNIVLCGSYQNKLTTDDAELETNGMACFITKINRNSSTLWLRQIEGNDYSIGKSVVTDDAGNVYITGHFSGNIIVGDRQFVSNGFSDIFVVAYSYTGDLLWFRQFGSSKDDSGTGLCMMQGCLYLTCTFSDKLSINSITIGTPGSEGILLIKMNLHGNTERVYNFGGTYCRSAAITASKNNSIVLCGSFGGGLKFGNTSLVSQGVEDIFIACCDTVLHPQWITGAGNEFNDRAYGIISGNNNELFCTGSFCGSIMFGDQVLSSAGSEDIFLVSLNESYISSITETIVPIDTGIIDIYPNPFRNKFHVELKNGMNADYIRITDISGKEIERRSILESLLYEFDLTGKSSSTYIIEVYSDGKLVFSGKLVKE